MLVERGTNQCGIKWNAILPTFSGGMVSIFRLLLVTCAALALVVCVLIALRHRHALFNSCRLRFASLKSLYAAVRLRLTPGLCRRRRMKESV